MDQQHGVYHNATDQEEEEEEDFIVVEPTDPDEDRLKEAALINAQRVNTPAIQEPPPLSPNPPGLISIDIPKNAIPGDPLVLNQILRAFTAKFQQPQQQIPVTTTTLHLPQLATQQPRILVASANNVLTLQAPIQTNGGGTPVQSFMVHSLNGLQAARLLNLPPSSQQQQQQQPITSTLTVPTTSVQQLQSTGPSLSAVLVNCATANLLTQLANSISSSMLSFAQAVAADKVTNPATQIAEVSQMLAVLTSLASNLASALPGLATARTPASVVTATVAAPVSSTILSSLIAHPHRPQKPPEPFAPLPVLSIQPPRASVLDAATKVLPSQRQGLQNIEIKLEPPSPHNGEKKSSPTAGGLVTNSGRFLSSVKLSSPRRFVCSFSGCNRAFNCRFNLVEHLRIHTGETPFVCPEIGCQKRFKKRWLLSAHAKSNHAESSNARRRNACPLVVSDAPIVAHSENNQRELKTSKPKKLFNCPYDGCARTYSAINQLRGHIRIHIGERPRSCTHTGCNESFESLTALLRHQLTHIDTVLPDGGLQPAAPTTLLASAPPSIPVSSPQKIFLQTIAPSGVHLKTLLSAPQPPLKLEPQDSLVTSAVSMAPKISIGCPGANRMLTKVPLVQRSPKAAATPSASALAEKAIVVAGPFGRRRHICPMAGCTKIFPKLNKLREHICRHTGERPYACEECPATFVRMYDLRRHAMIHVRKKGSILSSGI